MATNDKTPPNHDSVDGTNEVEGITLVPEQSREYCNRRQFLDYREHRERFVRWLLNLGKDPEHAEGYAHSTARRRAYDTDGFYRFVWDQRGAYTLDVSHADADDYCRELALTDDSDAHRANTQKSLKCLFRWRDDTEDWEPDITFSGNTSQRRPRDYLTRKERKQIREAALEYGSVPSPYSLTASEREKWERHLAVRFRKPAEDITRQDFERANGFKIPSLVSVGLDGGLRPAEIGRARVSWVDTSNALLRIPTEEAAKHRDNWEVPIRQRTAQFLDQWLDERGLYGRYEGSDRLWLTREGEPYSSRSLKYVLRRLCDEAGIDYDNRKMTWYAVRHSTGTVMAREEGLEAAAAQLRHSSLTTTRKYDQAPIQDRRDALDRME
jgi:integrase